MINRLVIENLKSRWLRTLLSAVVIGVQVMLLVTLIGLSRGLLADSASRAKGSGADIWLKPDTQGSIAISSGQVNEKFVKYVAGLPHVKQAVGVLVVPIQVPTTLTGVEVDELARMSGRFRYLQGGPPTNADDLLIDDYFARENHLRPGMHWKLLNRQWRISGVIQSGVLGRLIVQLKPLQTLNGTEGRISQILVKLDNPAATDAEVAELNKLLKGNLQAISAEAFISQFTINSLPQLKAFIDVIVVLAILVGFLVVFLSMYTAVIERTREIGILKALGAKPLTILNILVREAVVLSLVGCVLGIVFSFGAKGLVLAFVPSSLPVINAPDWWFYSAIISLVGALLGSVYPGLRAARQDAIEALAYE
jgi:putative ABC transport system permease protein